MVISDSMQFGDRAVECKRPGGCQLSDKERVSRLLQVGKENGFWSRGIDFPVRARQLFGAIDLRGKGVLEIGCGRGEFCLWAGIHGAQHVVGLEPMSDGFYDAANYLEQFRRVAARLDLTGVEMRQQKLQEHEASSGSYDLVISVASINHVDEPACIHLHDDSKARATFVSVFSNLARIMAPGGKLVIIDAMRRNLFGDLGLRSPFNPDVEWFKHQQPSLWAEVLTEARFTSPRVRYLGNRVCRYAGVPYVPRSISYCLDSLFRLEMTLGNHR